MPALGLSLILLAAGLIMALAVEATVTGVDIVVIGVILTVIGAFGVVLSLLFMMSLLPWGAERTTVVEDHYHEPHVR